MAGYAAGNIVEFIRGFGERKKQAAVRDELKNYLTKPEETIAAVNTIDAPTAISLNQQHIGEQQAQLAAQNAASTRNIENFGKVRTFLRGLPQGADVGTAFDTTVPFLTQQMGMKPEAIAAARNMIVSNPGVLMDDDAYKESIKSHVLTPGAALYTGGAKVGEQPFAPQVRTTNDGQGGSAVVVVDPNSGAPVSGGAAGGGSRATRNNNPGNIVDSQFAKSQPGYKGTDGRFAVFETPEQGTAAQTNLLGTYIARGFDTPAKIIARWAPKGDGNNDPAAYAQTVSQLTGIGVNDKVTPAQVPALVAAMARVEGGASSPSNATAGPSARTVASFPGQQSVRAATQEEIAAAGFPPGTAGQMNVRTGQLVNLKTPPVAKGTPEATEQARLGLVDSMTRLKNAAKDIMDDPALPGATGSIQGRVPSLFQGSVDFDNKVQALKDNVMLAALSALKAASKTGATGMGGISNKEGARLENMLGTLNQSSGDVTFKKTLQAAQDFADNIIERAGKATAAAPPDAPVIRRNPKTGAMVTWNGKGWVPYKGAQ